MRMKEKHDLIAKDLELDPINVEGCDGSVALGKLLVGSKVIGVTTVNDVSQDIVVCDGVLLYIKHGRKKYHLKICADFEGNLLGISKTKIDRNTMKGDDNQ